MSEIFDYKELIERLPFELPKLTKYFQLTCKIDSLPILVVRCIPEGKGDRVPVTKIYELVRKEKTDAE